MSMGERIRRCRKAQHLTQRQVAEAVGISEAAIRHYENGIRTPGAKQIEAIARVLGVRPESLTDYSIDTSRDALEVLFRLEDLAGLRPSKREGETVLAPSADAPDDISYALITWTTMREKLDSGEITQEEYDEWKASY